MAPRVSSQIPEFLVEGLIQFPDYPMLRSILPKIHTHGRDLGTGNCMIHDVWEYPATAKFIAAFSQKPWAAYVSELRGGEFMDPHKDTRTAIKLHFPIQTENCRLYYHAETPGNPIIAEHLYRNEQPVLLCADRLHSVRNQSRKTKYSLILAWENLTLADAKRILVQR